MPQGTQTVLVTGASAGIGAACARAFAAAGARLVLAARRRERLDELAAGLRGAHGTDVHLLDLDVRDRAAVAAAIGGLPPEWAAVDVLVNNAGLGRGLSKLYEGDPAEWDEMVDTNVKGLLYVTRAVVPGMVERGRGHVVNIGSVAGHEVYPGGAVYCATKHAVGAITRGLRMDLLGSGVRVSTVDPGMVETEFSVVRFRGDRERAKGVYRDMTPLTADDIADAVVWATTRPPHVNVDEIIVKPTDQASAMQVHRRRSDG
ncbi:MAG TPA: SDR family NAD(P)-dependent oxidoreductase [Longimicrobiaceae bacterium]|nr:SDR family NAD(P)-dependent oxidoreductase [Longimicrobiaceae bacterium]